MDSFCYQQREGEDDSVVCALGVIIMGQVNKSGGNVGLTTVIHVLKSLLKRHPEVSPQDVEEVCNLLSEHREELKAKPDGELLVPGHVLSLIARRVPRYDAGMLAIRSDHGGLLVKVNPEWLVLQQPQLERRMHHPREAPSVSEGSAAEIEMPAFEPESFAAESCKTRLVDADCSGLRTSGQEWPLDVAGEQSIITQELPKGHALAAKGIAPPDATYPGEAHMVLKNCQGPQQREVHFTRKLWKDSRVLLEAYKIKLRLEATGH